MLTDGILPGKEPVGQSLVDDDHRRGFLVLLCGKENTPLTEGNAKGLEVLRLDETDSSAGLIAGLCRLACDREADVDVALGQGEGIRGGHRLHTRYRIQGWDELAEQPYLLFIGVSLG